VAINANSIHTALEKMLYLYLTYMARVLHESVHCIGVSGTLGSVAVLITWRTLYFALVIMPVGHFHDCNIYWNVNCNVCAVELYTSNTASSRINIRNI
jgi:hypothetical protein